MLYFNYAKRAISTFKKIKHKRYKCNTTKIKDLNLSAYYESIF